MEPYFGFIYCTGYNLALDTEIAASEELKSLTPPGTLQENSRAGPDTMTGARLQKGIKPPFFPGRKG